MKQFSILLLILICTQTTYGRALTRLMQAAHLTRRLHISPKIHPITIHPKYNINEQDEATQIRAAILAENREYQEALNEVRYNLVQAYREDRNVYSAEKLALFNTEMLTKAHHSRLKELQRRLKKAEAKT